MLFKLKITIVLIVTTLYSFFEKIASKQSMSLKSAWRFIFIAVLSVGIPVLGFSQTDYFSKSADNEVALEVSRGDTGIHIALLFTKASQFEFVVIERSSNAMTNFSQIKYIKFNDSANDSVVIVKRDTYPLMAAEDVYYRVKTITKEGVTRTYPPARLPAISDDKKRN